MSNIIKAEYVEYNGKNRKNGLLYDGRPDDYPKEEDLYQIYEQKQTIITEAKNEASLIIETAKKNVENEIDELKKKAYEEGRLTGLKMGRNEGYDLGYEEGLKKIEKELNDKNDLLLDEIKNIIITMEDQKDIIISKFERDIARVSIDIAEKIIKQKVNSDDNLITKIIGDVIKDYKNVEWIKIYISEQDSYKMIEADRTLINELHNISDNVKIEPMNDLEKGNCIIETPDAIVDAGLKTQLNNLKEIVMNN